MPEWWSYTLADFLMFSPRVYWRLIERYNAAVWPAQIGVVAAALWLGLRARAPDGGQGRLLAVTLAAAWGWVAYGFLWTRYADINWPARWFAVLFLAEALLLLWLGLRDRITFGRRTAVGGVGLALYAAAVVLYPLIAPAEGRGWRGAELVGLLPEPTAVATIGILLGVAEPGARRALLLAPVLWCLVGGLTLLALGSEHAWAPWLALLVLATASWHDRAARDQRGLPRGHSAR